MNDVMML